MGCAGMLSTFWVVLFSGQGGKILFLNHRFMGWALHSVSLRTTQFKRSLLAGGLLVVPLHLTRDQKPWEAALIYRGGCGPRESYAACGLAKLCSASLQPHLALTDPHLPCEEQCTLCMSWFWYGDAPREFCLAEEFFAWIPAPVWLLQGALSWHQTLVLCVVLSLATLHPPAQDQRVPWSSDFCLFSAGRSRKNEGPVYAPF